VESETEAQPLVDAGSDTPAAAVPPAAAAGPGQALAVETPVAKPLPKRKVISRRVFILGGFWSSLGLAALALLGSPLDYMWPRGVTGFGGPIRVSPDRIPPPGGDPVRIVEGRFWLLNLEAGVTPNGETTPGGALALWQRCPHLGCTVPWRSDFVFLARRGWFNCPCHGSTYTKEGGIAVFGPAPRPLDVFPIEVQEDGSLIVRTGRQYEGSGSSQNPARAVPLEPGNATPDLV
jgi:cytochrome b6-f complex iron-sulfur subunit